MEKNGVRMNSPFWMAARGITGRDNATSGKRECRFYLTKGTASKENHSEPKVLMNRELACGSSVPKREAASNRGLLAAYFALA